jgi:hypothetical protein
VRARSDKFRSGDTLPGLVDHFFVGLDWSMKAKRRTTAIQKFSWENFGRYFVARTAPNQIPHKRAYLGTRQ